MNPGWKKGEFSSKDMGVTLDGSEIRPPQLIIDSLSHYLQGFLHIPGGFLARFFPSRVCRIQGFQTFIFLFAARNFWGSESPSLRIPWCPVEVELVVEV